MRDHVKSMGCYIVVPNSALKQKLQHNVKATRSRDAAGSGGRVAVQFADVMSHEEPLDTSEICQDVYHRQQGGSVLDPRQTQNKKA